MARRQEGERGCGPRQSRRLQRQPKRRKRRRGCGRRKELLPRPLTPSAALLRPGAGRGYVEPARAGEPLGVRSKRTPAPAPAARANFVAAPQVSGQAEVCMWGARASRRAAAVLSGTRQSGPEEEGEEQGKRGEGARAGGARDPRG